MLLVAKPMLLFFSAYNYPMDVSYFIHKAPDPPEWYEI